MAQTVKLEVATPVGRALDTETESVQVPGAAGEFGVLAGHLPILAALKPGILKYRQDGTEQKAAVGGGFAEADAAGVRLITEFYATKDQVNVEQARQDLETAQERLKTFKGEFGDPEHREAQRDLDWALARLELAG